VDLAVAGGNPRVVPVLIRIVAGVVGRVLVTVGNGVVEARASVEEEDVGLDRDSSVR